MSVKVHQHVCVSVRECVNSFVCVNEDMSHSSAILTRTGLVFVCICLLFCVSSECDVREYARGE